MNCLVLGGAGFMGSHLTEALLAAGHRVRVFDKLGVSRKNIQGIQEQIEFLEGDFSDSLHLQAALEGVENIFHLIGTTLPQTSNENTVFDISSNLISTLRLLELCLDKRFSVKKVIFSSSGGTVYGIPRTVPITEDHPTEPFCSYGIQKLAIEKYLALYHRLYGLEYCVLRFSNLYGERQRPDLRQGAVSVFIDRAIRGVPIEIWGDGSVVRDYLHVSDASRAFLAALGNKCEDRLFNIGSGVGHSLNELMAEIEKVLEKKVERRYMPSRLMDVPVNILSIEKAGRCLGWAPRVDFAEGIRRAVAAMLPGRPGETGKKKEK